MRFQIEPNSLKQSKSCLICRKRFQTQQARLIVCDNQGDSYGDVCPQCVTRGAYWIACQLQQSNNKVSA